MPKRFLFFAIGAALVVGVFVEGCINLESSPQPSPRLYVLTAQASDADRTAATWPEDITIGVGPLVFPDYLDRPQMVTRSGDIEMIAAPRARWAEPLKENTIRVLVENLATLAGSGAVYRYPWWAQSAPQFQLQMEIDRFDATRNGDAILSVSWEWRDRDGKSLMRRTRSRLHEPVRDDSNEAVVTAMSRLLLVFSRLTATRLAALAM